MCEARKASHDGGEGGIGDAGASSLRDPAARATSSVTLFLTSNPEASFAMRNSKSAAQTFLRIRLLAICYSNGGEGGIRTPGRVATTTDFESATFDHSATSPYLIYLNKYPIDIWQASTDRRPNDPLRCLLLSHHFNRWRPR